MLLAPITTEFDFLVSSMKYDMKAEVGKYNFVQTIMNVIEERLTSNVVIPPNVVSLKVFVSYLIELKSFRSLPLCELGTSDFFLPYYVNTNHPFRCLFLLELGHHVR